MKKKKKNIWTCYRQQRMDDKSSFTSQWFREVSIKIYLYKKRCDLRPPKHFFCGGNRGEQPAFACMAESWMQVFSKEFSVRPLTILSLLLLLSSYITDRNDSTGTHTAILTLSVFYHLYFTTLMRCKSSRSISTTFYSQESAKIRI